MDHMSLKYLLKKPKLNPRQAWWIEFLCEFDFDIKHVKGEENKVTNALSKKIHVAAFSVFKIDLRERILKSLTSDKFYCQVKGELHSKEQNNKKYEGCQIEEDGIFLHQNRMYIPCDVCGGVRDSTHTTSNWEHNKSNNIIRAKSSGGDCDRDFSRATLRKVILD